MATPTKIKPSPSKKKATEAAGKVPRLMELVTLMQAGTPPKAEDIARHFNVSIRTVRRYVKDLNAANIPCYYDEEARGFRIRRDWFLQPVQLTLAEATTLALLCEKVAGASGIPNLGPARSALSKIESVLPTVIRDEVRKVCEGIDIRTAQTEPDGPGRDVYETVRRAIRGRRALKCRYEAARPDAEVEAFEFEPYALFFSVRAWYAVGRHVSRRAVRSLKLIRFESVDLLDRGFTVPKGFSVEKHLGNAWRMIRGDEDHDVEVRFDAEFAQGVSETLWHRTQEWQNHDDGSVTMTFRVSGLDEVCWWLLSMGPHVSVVRPKALRERVADLARRTAAVHEAR
ncbi:MAG: transcriptional regulator [Planctomycetes bacterium]|nr:transcriptional regulator [Planctomycetota bacterium]